MSIAAYKRTISETESPRQIERRVLSRVTADLERFGPEFDQAEASAEKLALLAGGLNDALWRNQRVWMALQGDLAQPGNQLPADLRAGLISLAVWVNSHSNGVIKGKHKVQPLIDINKTIIRALEGNPLQVME
ncbi:flagellar biosynthesis regulator FlaF [Pseudodonghicola xiamenensis]|uniref:Flagellar biosynthesis regulatory protein FlaF n=1 Tax=Pseudodonghicola xiamenensis TaxID=337702 RepID=A0A8J3H4D3_9RHOB|nr:flagellar biosynthesis regulator FlaF [Pseudodonghicola xiamenensis]GHG85312.1 flagellar biosynthesis regulatory protein FlaF [Pseudodonghicola xiamenensis]